MLRVNLLNPESKPVVLRTFKNNAFIKTCKAAFTNTFGTTFFSIFGKKGGPNMAAIALLAISHFVLTFGARGVAQRRLKGHVEFLLPHLSRVTPCLPRFSSKCNLGEDVMEDSEETKIILKTPAPTPSPVWSIFVF